MGQDRRRLCPHRLLQRAEIHLDCGLIGRCSCLQVCIQVVSNKFSPSLTRPFKYRETISQYWNFATSTGGLDPCFTDPVRLSAPAFRRRLIALSSFRSNGTTTTASFAHGLSNILEYMHTHSLPMPRSVHQAHLVSLWSHYQQPEAELNAISILCMRVSNCCPNVHVLHL